MSRIHEALKRVEQEKATGRENGSPAECAAAVGEIVGDAPRSISESEPAIVPPFEAKVLPATLRFEDVWANCSRP